MCTYEYGTWTSSLLSPLFVNVGNDPGKSVGGTVVDSIEGLSITRGDYDGIVGYLKAGEELVKKFGRSGRWVLWTC